VSTILLHVPFLFLFFLKYFIFHMLLFFVVVSVFYLAVFFYYS